MFIVVWINLLLVELDGLASLFATWLEPNVPIDKFEETKSNHQNRLKKHQIFQFSFFRVYTKKIRQNVHCMHILITLYYHKMCTIWCHRHHNTHHNIHHNTIINVNAWPNTNRNANKIVINTNNHIISHIHIILHNITWIQVCNYQPHKQIKTKYRINLSFYLSFSLFRSVNSLSPYLALSTSISHYIYCIICINTNISQRTNRVAFCCCCCRSLFRVQFSCSLSCNQRNHKPFTFTESVWWYTYTYTAGM